MSTNASLLRMTVPVLEEQGAIDIVVPTHGLPVPKPANGFFYGLTGGDCKMHYKSAAQWAASRAGKKIATVEIDVARPKNLNLPIEGLKGIRGLPILHVRYMKRGDKDELALLCGKEWASGSSASSTANDWSYDFDDLVDHPEIIPFIFRSLKHLKILVLPMRTSLMSDPTWVAAIQAKTLRTDVRNISAVASSRRIVHPMLMA